MGIRRNPSRIGQGGAGLDRLNPPRRRPRPRNCRKIEDEDEDEDETRSAGLGKYIFFETFFHPFLRIRMNAPMGLAVWDRVFAEAASLCGQDKYENNSKN